MVYPIYSDMKDSGVDWLGEVPSNWAVKKIKYLVQKIGSGKTPKGGAEVYVSDGIALLRSQNIYDDGLRLDDVVFITEEANDGQKNSEVFENDVLLNITGASIGRTSIMKEKSFRANVNQHVCIFRPNLNVINPNFLHYFFCSIAGKEQVLSGENGTSREGLNFQQAGRIMLSVPGVIEQQSIVDFLDIKTFQIDALIAKKQALLEKLAEKRTALISQAVTKGLDPSVPMKDSGVDWLGEIPAHWDFVQFSHFIHFQEGPGIMAVDFRDEGVPLLRIHNVQSESVDLDGCNYLDEEKVEKKWDHYKLNIGDLLISCSASTGLVSEVTRESEGAIAYTGIIRLTPARKEIVKNFIRVFVSSSIFFDQISILKTGTTIQHFGPAHLRQMKLPLPPKGEQIELARYVDAVHELIDQQVFLTNDAIVKLKEYRSALITSAVTGKIDVRNIVRPEISEALK